MLYLALDPDNDTAPGGCATSCRNPATTRTPRRTSGPRPRNRAGSHGWAGGCRACSTVVSQTVGFILLALLIAGAVYVVFRVRRETRRKRGDDTDDQPGSVLGGVVGTADQFRADAQAALAAGDYNAAVLAAMRAIAQTASDRTLLLGARSATAHDIVRRLRHIFPAHYPALYTAADVFDAVAYGGAGPIRHRRRRWSPSTWN